MLAALAGGHDASSELFLYFTKLHIQARPQALLLKLCGPHQGATIRTLTYRKTARWPRPALLASSISSARPQVVAVGHEADGFQTVCSCPGGRDVVGRHRSACLIGGCAGSVV